MSSLCNRIYDDSLNLLGPRKHGVRTRRVSVRKQMLHRREDLATGALYNFSDRQHADSQYALSPCSSNRARYMKETGLSTVSTLKHRSAGGFLSFAEPSSATLSSFYQSHQYQGPVPLPPAILRVNMPGSPLSPYEPNNYSEYVFPRSLRSSSVFGGARTMGTGGRFGGGGGGGRHGDTPVPSGIHPGQEGPDSIDGDAEGDESEGGRPTPSSYTFRRRNAIVEGSEDAPRADDFSDSS
ncbi:hypothetical protein BGZ65_010982 [Modicella reniformis]|uniref:Uncharacterized protein n=1 Tax=Modicella reniformis TaxID=1440133 RepID=A0A9P6IRM3_9FUNG|nr:hypothetical protein BGZ65_010982 [Modicella reniformis]